MKKKIVGAIIAVIILIGIVITFTIGLNFDLLYKEHKEIEIVVGQEFDNNEIATLAKEVFENQKVVIRKVELYKDMVSIAVEDITDEQKEALNNKLNEKYGQNNSIEDVIVTEIPHERLSDLVKPYIKPVIISFVLISAYLLGYLFIYKRSGNEVNIVKAMLEFVCGTAVIQLLYLSVFAICRLPVDRLTIPFALVLFIATSIMKFIKK